MAVKLCLLHDRDVTDVQSVARPQKFTVLGAVDRNGVSSVSFSIARRGWLTYKPPGMLQLLRVRNFALIDELELELEKGFNLLSGETGAGKSLIVDALSLLAGAKASPDVIRTGEQRAIIEAVFEAPADLALESVGLDAEAEELIVRREIFSGNRNRVYINSQPSTVTALRSLAPGLLEVHGQHEQQTLLDIGHQLALIDRVGSAEALGEQVRTLYDGLRRLEDELSALTRAESEKLQRTDLLQFQRDEIEAVNPQDGETERLGERVRVLEHSGKLLETAAESYQALYEAEPSVLSMLAAVEKSLREVAAYDRSLENIVEQSASASATVEDMAYALRDYVQTIDADPAELEHLQGRLAELERLHRKYGPELLTHLAKVIRELDNLGLAETNKADIRRQLTELRNNYARAAGDLRTIRHRVSKTLEQSVTEELRSLAMPMADFSIHWKPIEPSATGMDLPVFLLAPNPGEEPGPLAQIASGGELSRVMLALRTVLAVDGGDKTLVFDEIDAGIGGEAAETVGRRLRELSRSYQVLCVTHLSQVARFADHHHRIEKLVVDGRTVTHSETLDDTARVEELARMMSGTNISSAARRHVKELLKRQ